MLSVYTAKPSERLLLMLLSKDVVEAHLYKKKAPSALTVHWAGLSQHFLSLTFKLCSFLNEGPTEELNIWNKTTKTD